MNQKLKFVVHSVSTSKVFTDPIAAVDACRKDIGTPCKPSMDRMRLIVDGRVQLNVGTDFIFFNNDWVYGGDEDETRYVQLFVCEDA